MRTTQQLMAAPTGMQPGGYVPRAYADRTQPSTAAVEVEVTPQGAGFRIALAWECPEPVRDVRADPGLFCDAAALLAPSARDAPWITMGAPGNPLDGVLWRADGDALLAVRAEGMGSLERSAAPKGWSVRAAWGAGRWRVAFETPEWPSLAQQHQLAVAIWRGAARERGGLKSVTPGWIEVKP